MAKNEESEVPKKPKSFRFVCSNCSHDVVGKDFMRTNRALGAAGWALISVGIRGDWRLHCPDCIRAEKS